MRDYRLFAHYNWGFQIVWITPTPNIAHTTVKARSYYQFIKYGTRLQEGRCYDNQE